MFWCIGLRLTAIVELEEGVFDQMTNFVEVLVVEALGFMIGLRRDDRLTGVLLSPI